MGCIFRSLSTLFMVLLLSACNNTVSTGNPNNSQSQQIASSTSLIVVNNAYPTSGNGDLDFVGARAVDMGSTTRVRLLKTATPYDYELVVYFDRLTYQVSQVSLSWVYNKTVLNNAYSMSPAGATVDPTRKKIFFSNTLLNSGLPSTANLNGQFTYIY